MATRPFSLIQSDHTDWGTCCRGIIAWADRRSGQFERLMDAPVFPGGSRIERQGSKLGEELLVQIQIRLTALALLRAEVKFRLYDVADDDLAGIGGGHPLHHTRIPVCEVADAGVGVRHEGHSTGSRSSHSPCGGRTGGSPCQAPAVRSMKPGGQRG